MLIEYCRYIYQSIKLQTQTADLNRPFVLVTASDSSHSKSLMRFIKSATTYEKNCHIVVYDLGLTDNEQTSIKTQFPSIDFRRFPFEKYPSYFNISINAGEYAWKPIIIQTIMEEFKSNVCWMDAGNIITSPLIQLRKILDLIGFYSPYSNGTIKEWTHPKSIAYLKMSPSLIHKRNLNGACISVNYHNEAARSLITKWANCALEKHCIAPEGSSRENHRQDQAILTVLAYQAGIAQQSLASKRNKYFGFKIHQDID